MKHQVLWALPQTLLFRDEIEALMLWKLAARAFPRLDAMCIMPDHVHVLLPEVDPLGVATLEAAYARARNARRGESGAVWARHPDPEEVPVVREGRVRRYILLNPCRKGLADDPAAWAWSTHRDRVGLTARPVGPVAREPERFHRLVSSDETVAIGGTPLPMLARREATWEELEDAVMAVFRCGPEGLRRRGPARTALVLSAWATGHYDVRMIRDCTRMSPCRTYQVVKDGPPPGSSIAEQVQMVLRVAGDKRFRPFGLDIPKGWDAYRYHR